MHRRQPHREGAGVVLNQHAEEALHRAEQCAVDHQRAVARAVGCHVFEFEPLRQVEVELHGRELPGAANGINQLDINLGPVENRLAFHAFEGNVHPSERVHQRALGLFPVFDLAGVVRGPVGVAHGKLHFVVLKAEGLEQRQRKIHAGFNLGFDLVGGAENVGVVLRKAAHAQQPVQHARALPAIDGAELGQPDGQLAVAAQRRLVNQDVAGAVHGLQLVGDVFVFHGGEHVLAVVVEVAGGLPQVLPQHVRGIDQIVTAPQQLLAQPVFHQVTNDAALGMPEDQPRAGFFLNAEEVEFLAELAMVAALGFFQLVQVVVKLGLRGEAGAVDALHLRVAFFAFPIGAGDAQQLERLDEFGRGDVRAQAEVNELAGGVELHHLAVREVAHQLALERLLLLLVELHGLVERNQFALVGQVLVAQLGHLLFDFFQVLGREGLLAQELVEEALVGGWADAELHFGIEFQHRGGQ